MRHELERLLGSFTNLSAQPLIRLVAILQGAPHLGVVPCRQPARERAFIAKPINLADRDPEQRRVRMHSMGDGRPHVGRA